MLYEAGPSTGSHLILREFISSEYFSPRIRLIFSGGGNCALSQAGTD